MYGDSGELSEPGAVEMDPEALAPADGAALSPSGISIAPTEIESLQGVG